MISFTLLKIPSNFDSLARAGIVGLVFSKSHEISGCVTYTVLYFTYFLDVLVL
jgi:hypothetical protein